MLQWLCNYQFGRWFFFSRSTCYLYFSRRHSRFALFSSFYFEFWLFSWSFCGKICGRKICDFVVKSWNDKSTYSNDGQFSTLKSPNMIGHSRQNIDYFVTMKHWPNEIYAKLWASHTCILCSDPMWLHTVMELVNAPHNITNKMPAHPHIWTHNMMFIKALPKLILVRWDATKSAAQAI